MADRDLGLVSLAASVALLKNQDAPFHFHASLSSPRMKRSVERNGVCGSIHAATPVLLEVLSVGH